MVGVDQHVADLAECAVGHQTAVIKEMVEAAEIITFACGTPSLVISPMSTLRCSDVNFETLLRRGLPELGIPFGVTRRTRDLGVDTGGGAGRAVGVMRKTPGLRKAAKRSGRLGVIRRHTKKSVLGRVGIAESAVRGTRAVCPKAGRCITFAPRCGPSRAGRDRVHHTVIGFRQISGEFHRARMRRARRLSHEQLRDGSFRWMKVRGHLRAVMCVLLEAGWFPLHPTNWKQARASEGVYWSFMGAGGLG